MRGNRNNSKFKNKLKPAFSERSKNTYCIHEKELYNLKEVIRIIEFKEIKTVKIKKST